MNKNEIIIIFAKHPREGEVKTRIQQTVGAKLAVEIYQKLLECTMNLVLATDYTVKAYIGNDFPEHDIWTSHKVERHAQIGNDLGERMHNAFLAESKDFDRIILIGTDCPSITGEIIATAFQELRDHDLVLGPAIDGGYYLIGLKVPQVKLFQNVEWSTSTVLSKTLEIAVENKMSIFQLQRLSDVDTYQDWVNYLSESK
jgi:uncharacterized protein